MPHVIVTDSEFQLLHSPNGLPPVQIEQGTLLLEDGAVMKRTLMGDGSMHFNPPDQPSKLLSLKRRYWEAKVKLAEEHFHSLKRALRGDERDALGQPCRHAWNALEFGEHDGDWVESLKALRDAVLERRDTLAKIDEEIAALPQNVEKRKREEMLRQMEQETAQVEAQRQLRIESIRLEKE